LVGRRLALAFAGELVLLTPDEEIQKYEEVECVWD
jgi:hypothetical protein